MIGVALLPTMALFLNYFSNYGFSVLAHMFVSSCWRRLVNRWRTRSDPWMCRVPCCRINRKLCAQRLGLTGNLPNSDFPFWDGLVFVIVCSFG